MNDSRSIGSVGHVDPDLAGGLGGVHMKHARSCSTAQIAPRLAVTS
jgi:hypothetical protein